MCALKYILLALAFITLTAHAKDDRTLTLVQTGNTVSEKRIALVIGISKYNGTTLANPTNDARDMAVALRELGFDVTAKIDVTQKELNRAIAQFGEKLNANTIALFYYAGHGMQVKGKNYLIPVDAEIASETSVRAETVDVDTVLDQLNRSPLSIVILDACRNNPFERRFRSAGGGLAAMDAPKGTLIAYATSPGSVASDGSGRNGLYTQELLKAMRTPGLQVESMFKEVRRNVTRASGDTQTPWEMSSLTGEFYFKPGAQVANMLTVPAQVGVGEDSESAQWAEVQKGNSLEDYRAYLSQYPRGQYLILAQSRIKKLQEDAAAQARQEKEAAAQAHKTGAVFRDCPYCPEMVVIPAGSFDMGSSNGDEAPIHRVTIRRNFAMGKTEVTQGQWRAVMGTNPSNFSNCGDTCPVEQVSWNDAQAFIQQLYSLSGKQYRLPSEAEWEYTCRAGSQLTYCGSDNIDNVAWYNGNSDNTTHSVTTKQANVWGLYDMSGNVGEWTEDSYHDSYNGAPTDGTVWKGDGAYRVLRGGSWHNGRGIQAALRFLLPPETREYGFGFRLAKTLP